MASKKQIEEAWEKPNPYVAKIQMYGGRTLLVIQSERDPMEPMENMDGN